MELQPFSADLVIPDHNAAKLDRHVLGFLCNLGRNFARNASAALTAFNRRAHCFPYR
jgi:hypothetical protein